MLHAAAQNPVRKGCHFVARDAGAGRGWGAPASP
jgi:hypothetical protein